MSFRVALALGILASIGETTCTSWEPYSDVATDCTSSATDAEVDGQMLMQQRAQKIEKPEAEVAAPEPVLSWRTAAGEFIAMTLFVVIGCGSAMGIAKRPGSAWVLQVALTFGFAITVLAYSVSPLGAGQINCAVTLGLYLAGALAWQQALINFVAQMCGSIFGAIILSQIFPREQDLTGGMGSNGISEGFKPQHALVGEVVMTFLLVFTVLETAVNPLSEANRVVACIAIGFAVFLAHSVLIPIDGCSINPTRSFGPALVSTFMYKEGDTLKEVDTFKDHWVFWAGPLLGSGLAAGIFLLFSG